MFIINTEQFDFVVKKSSVFVVTKEETFHLGTIDIDEIVLYNLINNFKKNNLRYMEFKDLDIIFRKDRTTNTFEASIGTRYKMLNFTKLNDFKIKIERENSPINSFYSQ